MGQRLTPYQSVIYSERRARQRARAEAEEAGVPAKIANEDCRHCGRASQFTFPAGVVRGQWKCGSCGRWQNEAKS